MNSENVKSIVVTLFEKHYHFGVASLINSLSHAGFNGLVKVGYRGDLPPWVNQLEEIRTGEYVINKDILLSFEHLDTTMHFGYYKPYFLKETLEAYPEATYIYYFDPDIVVNAPWSFYSSWVDMGISLCLDNSFSFVHHNHPWRNEWRKLSNSSLHHDVDYYVNSGFIGLSRNQSTILDRWIDLTIKYQDIGGDIYQFEKCGDRAFKGDQDLLNAVITVSPDLTFSVIGLEGMGFTQPAYLMSHAVSEIKPWKKNFVNFLFSNGKGPDFSEKDYLKFANSPISVYSSKEYKFKRMNMKAASILGRIFG